MNKFIKMRHIKNKNIISRNNLNLKDYLEIIIVTYNRKTYLQNTFNQIFAKSSPIKDLSITILNNLSTDGTFELIERYRKLHPNIKHIENRRNIGGNANIAKAFEIAKAKYVWVLCDDDQYNFKHWQEIEDAIFSNRYDCILTEWKYLFGAKDYEYIINTLAFLPAGIYKTSNISTTVMSNIESNIMYSFPHLALGCSLLNNKKKFYIPKFRIIKQNINMEFNKSLNNEVHFRQANVNLFSGYINSYQMILDKKLRHKCCNVLWIGKPFYYSMNAFFKSNKFFIYNMSDILWGISNLQRLQFVVVGIYVLLSQIVNNIFSLKNTPDKKHKKLTILGIKIKLKKKKYERNRNGNK